MAEPVTARNPCVDFLLSPWMVLFGMGLGVYVGLRHPVLTQYLIPLGDVYLALLQMCILPILITAVISSLGRLILAGEANRYVGRLIFVFVFGLLIASATGILVGALSKPGKNLDSKARATLGQVLSQSEMSANSATPGKALGLMDFVKEMVPQNIFEAFSRGKNLSILFFCILLGVALGVVRSSSSQTAISVVEALYEACQKLISWVMVGLPIGLCCLFASQVSQVGLDILGALLKLVLFSYLAAFLLMLFYHLVIWKSSGLPFFKAFTALKQTLVIALGTGSSFAAIPSALQCLQRKMKLDRGITNLIIPLGVSINPQGSAMHFAIATLFIAQIYDAPISLQGYLIVWIGSVLAGMAATGAPGVSSLAMIALVLEPLGLPVEAGIILLLAIDPVLDPILTVLNIHGNCAATTLIASRYGTPVPAVSEEAAPVPV